MGRDVAGESKIDPTNNKLTIQKKNFSISGAGKNQNKKL
jgi:hypothetical protein